MNKPKTRILFVDDNEDTRLMVTCWLGYVDCEVMTADCLASGLQLALRGIFDVVVVDSRLPDGTGRDLCQKIREFDAVTPIIFYSGEAYETDRARALACGAQDYVVKPDLDSLPKAIARLVRTPTLSSH